jgi:predicted CoA-binding protein
MQLGSESEKAIKFCEKNDVDVVYGACVMIERVKYSTSNLASTMKSG